MRHPIGRRIVVRRISVAVLLTACLAAGFAVSQRSSRAATATPDGATQVATYTLITGERVAVSTTPDGRPNVTLASSASGTGAESFQVLASGQHLYVLPYYAAGYIGQPLSIDLFDVNALTPDTAATTAAQPQLTVDYTADSAQQLPPGLSKAQNGAVAVSDPKKFGQTLAKQWLANKQGATSHLFDGIAHISRAGAAAAATTATPTGALYTVTVKAFDRHGQRVEGDAGIMMNADNVDTYLAQQSFFRGNAAFSVPAGHYSISSYITTVYPDNSVDFTLAALPEVNVTHDMTVILDAHKGVPISVTAPQATTPVHEELNYLRNSQYGTSLTTSLDIFGNAPVYATPTDQVSAGKLYFYPYFRLGDAQGGSATTCTTWSSPTPAPSRPTWPSPWRKTNWPRLTRATTAQSQSGPS